MERFLAFLLLLDGFLPGKHAFPGALSQAYAWFISVTREWEEQRIVYLWLDSFSCHPNPLVTQVSNQAPSQQEFEKWQAACEDARMGQITRVEATEVKGRLLAAEE